jgi:hypothetical protein
LHGPQDPFVLPTRLNDLLTSEHYDNWDVALPAYMRLLTRIPEAQDLLDSVLSDPAATLERVASHYLPHYLPHDVPHDVGAAKQLLHALSMDGTVRAWRKQHNVPEHVEDLAFVLDYTAAMRRVTDEFVRLQAIEVIESLRPKLEPNRAKLTRKSFVLQHVEAGSREAKLVVLKAAELEHGSLEHDGVRCAKCADPAALQRRLTAAATRGAATAAA